MANPPREKRFPAWLLWVIGPVTFLTAAILILSVVLGIQAGQRQLEMQHRQEVGISLQRATDYRADGQLEAALAEYQRVLVLDPGNDAAVAGIEGLLQLAKSGGGAAADALSATATPTSVPSPVATVTPTSMPDALTSLWNNAVGDYEAGQWQAAVDKLLQIEDTDAGYRPEQLTDMLYNAYVNLAAEKDSAGKLEEALSFVDKALALRPEASELHTARTMAASYLDISTYFGADWPRAIELLQELYGQDPTYRDVQDRLHSALLAYGDALAAKGEWCSAAEQYTSAHDVQAGQDVADLRDRTQERCDTVAPAALAPTPVSVSVAKSITPTSASTALPSSAPTETAEPEPTTAPAPAVVSVGAPTGGRILYSAADVVNGRINIFAKPVASDAGSTLLVQDGQQPALRGDGGRLLYRNLRSDMRGISAIDPGSGLLLRFTEFGEDGSPSWNPENNRFVFASNREGDRLWRIYVAWADTNSEATTMVLGEAPEWHPTADIIVYRGCDETGNRCGLWTMTGSGTDCRPLTTVPADNHPTWSPDGRFVAFMSDSRDGNPEIYRADAATGQVTRLTNFAGNDGLPAVSPDSNWVAFLSNRNGVWSVWAVASDGGEAQLLVEVDGNIGNWLEQDIQWVN